LKCAGEGERPHRAVAGFADAVVDPAATPKERPRHRDIDKSGAGASSTMSFFVPGDPEDIIRGVRRRRSERDSVLAQAPTPMGVTTSPVPIPQAATDDDVVDTHEAVAMTTSPVSSLPDVSMVDGSISKRMVRTFYLIYSHISHISADTTQAQAQTRGTSKN